MFTSCRSIILITDTCSRAQWLSRIISWVLSSEEDVHVPQNDTTPILETLAEIYSGLQQWSLVPQKVKFQFHPFLLIVTFHSAQVGYCHPQNQWMVYYRKPALLRQPTLSS